MRYKQYWCYAHRSNNNLLPYGVSLGDIADGKAPLEPSARSVRHTCTLLLRTLYEILAELNGTKARQNGRLVSRIIIGQRALNEIVTLLEATESISLRRAYLAYLTVRQRVSTLRPVGSQFGMFGRWQQQAFAMAGPGPFIVQHLHASKRASCPARGRPSYSASRLRNR